MPVEANILGKTMALVDVHSLTATMMRTWSLREASVGAEVGADA
jgi:hypothetical protein